MSAHEDPGPQPVRVPADVERADRIAFTLTARQLAILAVGGMALLGGYAATKHVLPLAVQAALGFPLVVVTAAVALGRRDGMGLDRWLTAALRQRMAPKQRAPAPDGMPAPPSWVDAPRQPLPAPLKLPARAIHGNGVIDLGPEGVAVVAATSTVSFALRSTREQEALVAAFAGSLHAQTGPLQVLVRAAQIDLAPLVGAVEQAAPAMPHPQLETAARDYAGFLADLATHRDLLARQVLVIVREPAAGSGRGRDADAAARRVSRRAEETARALSAAGITVTVLDGAQAHAALATCADPFAPPQPPGEYAGPDDVITIRK